MLSFPSCHGILGDIYDEPSQGNNSPYGFYDVDLQNHRGKIYLKANSYTQWVYVNLDDQAIDSIDINFDSGLLEKPEADDWQFAVHRYDVKTNKGSAMETSFPSLDALVNNGKLPDGNLVADIPGKVTIDMSGMMEGNIRYADSPINEVLLKWLDVDTSTMPPIYTLSKKVYVMKTKSGKYAALYFSNYMNEANVKGYLTIEYIYPLEF